MSDRGYHNRGASGAGRGGGGGAGGGGGGRGRGRGWYYKEKYGNKGGAGSACGGLWGNNGESTPSSSSAQEGILYDQNMKVDDEHLSSQHTVILKSVSDDINLLPTKRPCTSSSNHPTSSTPSLESTNAIATQSLEAQLVQMDRQQYGRLKSLKGSYLFPDGILLLIDYIQSDPFAPASRLRVRVPQSIARFPPSLFVTRERRIALEDYLTRSFASHLSNSNYPASSSSGSNRGNWYGAKGGDFGIDKPGQQVLERTSMRVSSQFVEARITFNFPAQGRSIMGQLAARLLTQDLLQTVRKSLLYEALNTLDVASFVNCIEDQSVLRKLIKTAGLVAFVPNGAVLPRESGDSDKPMRSANVVKFQSPESLETEFQLPHKGVIKGMGIRNGVTLIVGGGFHGKSTLLEALQVGVYNHIPSDGREYLVSDPDILKIRAEDGRSVTKVDISPFISNLPFAMDTRTFSTKDASGSTSMASSIQEALEIGCSGFLFDEDTSATNFLIRDKRMEVLISKENEPITPLIAKVRSLYTTKGCSSILVVGGCGSYLDVADCVIGMVNFQAVDLTQRAKEVSAAYPVDGLLQDSRDSYGTVSSRTPILPSAPATQQSASSESASFGTRPPKSSTRTQELLTFNGIDVDLSGLEQLVSKSQTRCILETLQYLLLLTQSTSTCALRKTVKEWMEFFEQLWDAEKGGVGLDEVASNGYEGKPVGDLARVRVLELGGALNRLRGKEHFPKTIEEREKFKVNIAVAMGEFKEQVPTIKKKKRAVFDSDDDDTDMETVLQDSENDFDKHCCYVDKKNYLSTLADLKGVFENEISLCHNEIMEFLRYGDDQRNKDMKKMKICIDHIDVRKNAPTTKAEKDKFQQAMSALVDTYTKPTQTPPKKANNREAALVVCKPSQRFKRTIIETETESESEFGDVEEIRVTPKYVGFRERCAKRVKVEGRKDSLRTRNEDLEARQYELLLDMERIWERLKAEMERKNKIGGRVGFEEGCGRADGEERGGSVEEGDGKEEEEEDGKVVIIDEEDDEGSVGKEEVCSGKNVDDELEKTVEVGNSVGCSTLVNVGNALVCGAEGKGGKKSGIL
ncbi:hypothetical protein HDV05_002863 [Chytridiales sp. JEL 0842]|nr:hypothetical protein HDV05_002863 [Chytridiales sp. JEL 0842]